MHNTLQEEHPKVGDYVSVPSVDPINGSKRTEDPDLLCSSSYSIGFCSKRINEESSLVNSHTEVANHAIHSPLCNGDSLPIENGSGGISNLTRYDKKGKSNSAESHSQEDPIQSGVTTSYNRVLSLENTSGSSASPLPSSPIPMATTHVLPLSKVLHPVSMSLHGPFSNSKEGYCSAYGINQTSKYSPFTSSSISCAASTMREGEEDQSAPPLLFQEPVYCSVEVKNNSSQVTAATLPDPVSAGRGSPAISANVGGFNIMDVTPPPQPTFIDGSSVSLSHLGARVDGTAFHTLMDTIETVASQQEKLSSASQHTASAISFQCLKNEEGLTASRSYALSPEPLTSDTWINSVTEKGESGSYRNSYSVTCREKACTNTETPPIRPHSMGDKGGVLTTMPSNPFVRNPIISSENGETIGRLRAIQEKSVSGEEANMRRSLHNSEYSKVRPTSYTPSEHPMDNHHSDSSWAHQAVRHSSTDASFHQSGIPCTQEQEKSTPEGRQNESGGGSGVHAFCKINTDLLSIGAGLSPSMTTMWMNTPTTTVTTDDRSSSSFSTAGGNRSAKVPALLLGRLTKDDWTSSVVMTSTFDKRNRKSAVNSQSNSSATSISDEQYSSGENRGATGSLEAGCWEKGNPLPHPINAFITSIADVKEEDMRSPVTRIGVSSPIRRVGIEMSLPKRVCMSWIPETSSAKEPLQGRAHSVALQSSDSISPVLVETNIRAVEQVEINDNAVLTNGIVHGTVDHKACELENNSTCEKIMNPLSSSGSSRFVRGSQPPTLSTSVDKKNSFSSPTSDSTNRSTEEGGLHHVDCPDSYSTSLARKEVNHAFMNTGSIQKKEFIMQSKPNSTTDIGNHVDSCFSNRNHYRMQDQGTVNCAPIKGARLPLQCESMSYVDSISMIPQEEDSQVLLTQQHYQCYSTPVPMKKIDSSNGVEQSDYKRMNMVNGHFSPTSEGSEDSKCKWTLMHRGNEDLCCGQEENCSTGCSKGGKDGVITQGHGSDAAGEEGNLRAGHVSHPNRVSSCVSPQFPFTAHSSVTTGAQEGERDSSKECSPKVNTNMKVCNVPFTLGTEGPSSRSHSWSSPLTSGPGFPRRSSNHVRQVSSTPSGVSPTSSPTGENVESHDELGDLRSPSSPFSPSYSPVEEYRARDNLTACGRRFSSVCVTVSDLSVPEDGEVAEAGGEVAVFPQFSTSFTRGFASMQSSGLYTSETKISPPQSVEDGEEDGGPPLFVQEGEAITTIDALLTSFNPVDSVHTTVTEKLSADSSLYSNRDHFESSVSQRRNASTSKVRSTKCGACVSRTSTPVPNTLQSAYSAVTRTTSRSSFTVSGSALISQTHSNQLTTHLYSGGCGTTTPISPCLNLGVTCMFPSANPSSLWRGERTVTTSDSDGQGFCRGTKIATTTSTDQSVSQVYNHRASNQNSVVSPNTVLPNLFLEEMSTLDHRHFSIPSCGSLNKQSHAGIHGATPPLPCPGPMSKLMSPSPSTTDGDVCDGDHLQVHRAIPISEESVQCKTSTPMITCSGHPPRHTVFHTLVQNKSTAERPSTPEGEDMGGMFGPSTTDCFVFSTRYPHHQHQHHHHHHRHNSNPYLSQSRSSSNLCGESTCSAANTSASGATRCGTRPHGLIGSLASYVSIDQVHTPVPFHQTMTFSRTHTSSVVGPGQWWEALDASEEDHMRGSEPVAVKKEMNAEDHVESPFPLIHTCLEPPT